MRRSAEYTQESVCHVVVGGEGEWVCNTEHHRYPLCEVGALSRVSSPAQPIPWFSMESVALRLCLHSCHSRQTFFVGVNPKGSVFSAKPLSLLGSWSVMLSTAQGGWASVPFILEICL